MSRKTLLSLAVAVFASFFAVSAVSDRPPEFGDPFPGLTPAQRAAFADGLEEFAEAEEAGEGLGPVFNEASCATCHAAPAIGGGSERVETRFGKITAGQFDPMTSQGGSLLQDHAIGMGLWGYEYRPEAVPAEATITTGRRTTPLFGLGLVDAVPDGTFHLVAALQALRSDGTAGRVHLVTDLVRGGTSVGKFGWKAQVPSLLQFSGDAYLNEMGITNPFFPDESCPQGDCASLASNPMPGLNDAGGGVQAFADFMTMLAPPPRGPINGEVVAGEKIFAALGCESCHLATLQTGSSEIAALRHRPFHPYSDFLLHDMGELGDGIVQGEATGREIRTAPLWGLRMITRFLHDGRAKTIEEAILAHQGQGAGARERFAALDPSAKSRLLAFLNSL